METGMQGSILQIKCTGLASIGLLTGTAMKGRGTGRRQGLGMYTFRNGETQSGHWQNGVLSVPSTQNTTHRVSPIGVYHSKVLNAVQEARRAAEKTHEVGKVDERVNRAAPAANRAANAGRVAAIKAVQERMHDTTNNIDNPPIRTV